MDKVMAMPDHPNATPKISGATVAQLQLICGNTERVKDVVVASSGDHDDEVQADLGRSMKLPGNGGTTEVSKRGGMTKLPGKLKGAHQTCLG